MSAATPLSHRIRNETKDAHTTAERSGIMRDVLRGEVSREAYVALLVNLHAIYFALETQLDSHRHHEALRDVNWEVLARSTALEWDIRAFSNGGAPAIAIEPSTRAYVDHLHQTGARNPALLFAHAYLRYLGDLYGGQIMHRLLLKTFPTNSSFAFYNFSGIDNVEEFKANFRGAIDSLADRGASADSVVAEAQRGYELHADIFDELASPKARWRNVQ